MYKYGMRLRGFSLGCQPMDNFIKREDSHNNPELLEDKQNVI